MSDRPQIRKTKIVATIGPASDASETLQAMIRAGMNVARLNLSHGNFSEHAARVERIRQAAADVGAHMAIMLDTRGIEIRTGPLVEDYVELKPGNEFCLYTQPRTGDAGGVSVSYRRLDDEVRAGVPILVDDGAIELEVKEVVSGAVHCRVVHGGILRANKSVNLPDTELSLAAVSPEHRDDVVKEISFAMDHEIGRAHV